jgi:uncharacterized heparinase superfamily protein
MLGPIRFRFLNQEHKLQSEETWNDPAMDKLWLYNLHYFDDLNAEDADRRNQWHEVLIDCWIRENPHAAGNGWEPYPTSLRIVNWIKWSLSGHTLTPDMLQSLASQVRHLIRNLETHLLGNHLFANAKALCFAGFFFQGVEATNWLRIGCEILVRQVNEQVLEDGGHMERSPMYHSLILEDLLDLLNLMRAYEEEEYFVWGDKVESMRAWLQALCHPDGDISLFNDAAFGIAPSPQELDAYADRLGLAPSLMAESECRDLPASGYVRLADSTAVALLDLGDLGPDYLPAHGHADTLGFELSLHGKRTMVDSGISCYGTGEERHRQRGTPAHNTITVDDENSSVVWSGFRVAQRAKVIDRQVELGDHPWAMATHDGYQRLSGNILHKRRFSLGEESLVLEDWIEGSGHHRILLPLHLHPEVDIGSQEGNSITLVRPSGRTIARILFSHEGYVEEEEATYHPQFGVAQPTQRLVFRWEGSLPIHFSTRIHWGRLDRVEPPEDNEDQAA